MMKTVVINMAQETETMSEDIFKKLDIKKCSHSDSLHPPADGCVSAQIIDVIDPYYKKARKFPNGYLTYLNPYE